MGSALSCCSEPDYYATEDCLDTDKD